MTLFQKIQQRVWEMTHRKLIASCKAEMFPTRTPDQLRAWARRMSA